MSRLTLATGGRDGSARWPVAGPGPRNPSECSEQVKSETLRSVSLPGRRAIRQLLWRCQKSPASSGLVEERLPFHCSARGSWASQHHKACFGGPASLACSFCHTCTSQGGQRRGRAAEGMGRRTPVPPCQGEPGGTGAASICPGAAPVAQHFRACLSTCPRLGTEPH